METPSQTPINLDNIDFAKLYPFVKRYLAACREFEKPSHFPQQYVERSRHERKSYEALESAVTSSGLTADAAGWQASDTRKGIVANTLRTIVHDRQNRKVRFLGVPYGLAHAVEVLAELQGKGKTRNHDRDKFCYQQRRRGISLKEIKVAVNKRKRWERLETEQAVSQAAKRYARAAGEPWPIP